MYIVVADLSNSLQRCRELGGEMLVEPVPDEAAPLAVIKDPAGAVVALWQSGG